MGHNRNLTGVKCPRTVITLYVIHSQMQNTSHVIIFKIELQLTINSIVYLLLYIAIPDGSHDLVVIVNAGISLVVTVHIVTISSDLYALLAFHMLSIISI